MSRTLVLLLIASGAAAAQTTVYLRDDTNPVSVLTGAAAGPNNTIRLTVPGHNFAAGDKINVDGIGGCWRANGTRTVVSIDGSYVYVKGRAGENLTCGGDYRAPSSTGAEIYLAGKLAAYTLKGPPNVGGFDGPSGSYTQSIPGRCTLGNPAYDATIGVLSPRQSTYTTSSWAGWAGWMAFAAAMVWHGNGRPTCDPGNIVTNPNGTRYCTTNAYWVYLDMARWWVNNADKIYYTTGCDESLTNCGRSGLTNAIDQNAPEMQGYPRAYNLIYDQLTENEKQAFADKFLNNVGMHNDTETPCANQIVQGDGTVTTVAGSSLATLSIPSEASKVSIGDTVIWRVGSNLIETYNATAVNYATGVITLDRAVESGYGATGSAWYYSKPWTTGTCGHVWFMGHFVYNSLWTRDSHPPSGGNVYSYAHNLVWAKNAYYAMIGMATCVQDARGCELFERAQAFFWDRQGKRAKHMWTGATAAGSGTYRGRVDGHAGDWALMLKNGLMPSMDISGGVWLERNMLQTIYGNLPVSAGNEFHSWGDTAQRRQYAYQVLPYYTIPAAVSGAPATPYFLHWLFNRFTYSSSSLQLGTGKYAPYALAYIDPAASRTDYTGLSHQYLFQQTDLDDPPQQYSLAYSRTGWAVESTSILMYFLGSWEDHSTFKAPGSYQVFKGNYLYADGRGSNIASCYTDSCFSSEGAASSAVEVGDVSSATATSYVPWSSGQFNLVTGAQGSWMEVKRWAGTNPDGRSENDFAYVAYNARRANNTTLVGTTLNRQWYQYLHLKKDGRDHLLRHVDTSVAAARRHRGYLQFPNNEGPGVNEGYTAADSQMVVRTTTDQGTSMHTAVLLPSDAVMTDLDVRRTSSRTLTIGYRATETEPYRLRINGELCTFTAAATVTLEGGTGDAYLYVKPGCVLAAGHSGGVALSVSGVAVEAGVTEFPAGSYPLIKWLAQSTGWYSSGYIKGALPNVASNNRRFVVELGTGTDSEYLVFHDIHNSATAAGAPAELISGDSNWRTVQIGGTLPAVAAFSRAGRCYQSWNASTTHTGPAEYVIAGLCAGRYQVYRNGVVTMEANVLNGDETLAFSGPSGGYTVTLEGGINPVVITTTTVPAGVVSAPYSASLSAAGGMAPYRWSLVGNDTLCAGLALSESGLLFGTPTLAQTCSFLVGVQDNAGQRDQKTLTLTVTAASSLAITTTSLPAGQVGALYSVALTAAGGSTPYSWRISDGQLPAGLSLSAAGMISGTPTEAVSRSFTVTVRDSAAPFQEVSAPLSLTVQAGGGSIDVELQWATADRLLIRYGRAGLKANQTCTVRVGLANPVTNPMETYTDSGGAARRQYVVGSATALQPSTNYWIAVECGADTGVASMRTLAAGSSPGTLAVSLLPPSGLPVSRVRLDYGETAAVNQTQTVACAAGCSAELPARTPGLLYFRYTFEDATGRTLASSSLRVLPVVP